MTGLYFIFYALFCGMAIWSPSGRRMNAVGLAIVWFLLSIPSWRLTGTDREVYLGALDGTSEISEWSFYAVSACVQYLGLPDEVVFLVYSSLAIAVVLFAIWLCNRRIWWCVLVYYAYWYVIHPMIQIRAACSIAFFLLALVLVKRCSQAMALLLAVFWHYSALAVAFLYCFAKRSLRWQFLAIAIAGALVLYFVGFKLGAIISLMPISVVQNGFERYNQAMDVGKELNYNPFGIWKAFIICLTFATMPFWTRARRYMKSSAYINFWVGGICVSLVVSDFPAMAARLADFFCSVEIFLIPVLMFAMLKRIGVVGVICYSVLSTYCMLVRTGILEGVFI